MFVREKKNSLETDKITSKNQMKKKKKRNQQTQSRTQMSKKC